MVSVDCLYVLKLPICIFVSVNKTFYNPQLLFQLSGGLGKAVTSQIIVAVETLCDWLFSCLVSSPKSV